MPFNGSGTFVSLAPPDFPALPGTVILASSFNANMNDLFTNGLTKCLTRDGQSPPTANLPMAGFRFTGIGAGIADTDSAQLGQTLAVRGTVGVVDWDTKITNGIFESTAASLTGPATNFPPTAEIGQLIVMSQGANVIHNYITAFRSYQRRKVAGVWTAWATQLDQAQTVTVVSAATTSIGDVGSTDVIVSGTASITSFGPATVGVVKRLIFTGTATLTHNAASLILANAVGVTVAVSDTYTFVSLGGSNWREVARWRPISNAIALDILATNGMIARTAAGTVAARTITGTANEITVTNGDGVAGNPVISIPTSLNFAGKTFTNAGIMTTVDINGGTVDGAAIGASSPSTGAFTTGSFSGIVTLTSGQLLFPAAQNASANVNMLDDYEEGSWTPTVTAVVPGDLNVVYVSRGGTYTKIGRLVSFSFIITTSTWTYTTASGNLRVTGLPFAIATAWRASCAVGSNSVNAGTDLTVTAFVQSSEVRLQASDTSTGSTGAIDISALPSGVQIELTISGVYEAAT